MSFASDTALSSGPSSAPESPSFRPDVAPPRHRGAFGRQVRSELRLAFLRRRNIALLAVLAVAPVLIGIALKFSAPDNGEGPPFINQVTGNGLFLVFTALTVSLPLFLPLVVGVVAADSVANEASTGTLRYLLTVPVSRTRLLVVKAVVVVAFTTAAVLFVALVGLATGALLFGLDRVTLLSGDTVSLASGLLRALGVAGFVVVDLLGLVAIGMFISTLTEVPIGAMAATVGTAIIAEVLDAVPQLHGFRSVLFPHHWFDFGEFLRGTLDAGLLARSGFLQLAYIVIFGSLAWARFTTKDITS